MRLLPHIQRIFVIGKVENEIKKWISEGVIFYNYLLTNKLQDLINSSKIIICRSGYSSIMDLATLQKKVFFIPTKNKSEQEYLAKYLEENKIAPSAKESDFSLKKISKIKDYKGLKSKKTIIEMSLFGLFQSK